MLYTEKLLYVHPWSDPVDHETFLMGFDAGEQWSHGIEGWDTPFDRKSGRTSAWLTPEDGRQIREQVKAELRQ
jgi:hypothetical protein